MKILVITFLMTVSPSVKFTGNHIVDCRQYHLWTLDSPTINTRSLISPLVTYGLDIPNAHVDLHPSDLGIQFSYVL